MSNALCSRSLKEDEMMKKMSKPFIFVVSLKELKRYGWSPEEQIKNNPRIRGFYRKWKEDKQI